MSTTTATVTAARPADMLGTSEYDLLAGYIGRYQGTAPLADEINWDRLADLATGYIHPTVPPARPSLAG
jgi:hypothetical protein